MTADMRAVLLMLLTVIASAPAVARRLPLPAVPDSLRTPAARADYILLHFYDAMAWDDTAAVRDRALAEQSFADFASVIPHAGTDALRVAASALSEAYMRDSVACAMFAALCMQYLFERESPVRNLDACEVFLGEQLRLGYPDTTRARVMLDLMALNRPGTAAPDFEYTGRDGAVHRLSEHFGREFVLMFYDPDCAGCAAAMARLRDIDMPVVAIYSGAKCDVWERRAVVPGGWTDGIASEAVLGDDELYFAPALPTLYLIAPDGSVELRDASPDELLRVR